MNPKYPFKWRHFQFEIIIIMRAVVLAVSLELPQPGGDDAGEGTHGGPFNGVSLGAGLCSRTGRSYAVE